MSQVHHTPIAAGSGVRTAVVNAPLAELDAAIEEVVLTGSGATTTLDGSAASGQKVIPLTSTTGLSAGQSGIIMSDDGTDSETVTIASVSAGVSITATTNLTNSYASGDVFSVSPIEVALARGDYPTLGQRVTAGTYAASQRIMKKLEHDSADANLVVCSDSTAAYTTTWPYKLGVALAARYPAWTVVYTPWDDGSMDWDTPVELQSGSGDHTLTIWNASVSGNPMSYFLPYIPEMVSDQDPDLVLISLGHNDYAVEARRPGCWRDQMLALTQDIAAHAPHAGITLIAQNKRTGNSDYELSQVLRHDEYQWVAQARGYGYIDVWQAFMDTGDPDAYLSDGLHPNTAGQTLFTDTVLKAFEYRPWQDLPAQLPSSFLEGAVNLLPNGSFATFASPPTLTDWTASNCTLAKNSTNYESSNAYSVRMTASSAASSHITSDTAARLKMGKNCRGYWVTFAARIRIATASGTLNAALQLVSDGTDAVSTFTAFNLGDYDRFCWMVLSKYVPSDATYLAPYIYASTSSNASADVSVDRAILVRGLLPRDLL